MEVQKKVQELIDCFKEFDVDIVEQAKGLGLGDNEESIRQNIGLLFFDEDTFRKTYGVGYKEHSLMQDGLTLEEARYVIGHPCIENAEEKCSYHQEKGKCVIFGCTLLNGWLYYKTSPDKKPMPIKENMPKDILYIKDEDIGNKNSLNRKIDGFLDYVKLKKQLEK